MSTGNDTKFPVDVLCPLIVHLLTTIPSVIQSSVSIGEALFQAGLYSSSVSALCNGGSRY